MKYDYKKYKAYLKSDEWVQLKIDLLQERGCKCERCNKPRKPTSLQVHHITYKRLYDELAADLILLCGGCHMKEHGIKPTKKKKFTGKARSKVKKKAKNKPKNTFRKRKTSEYEHVIKEDGGKWRVYVNGYKYKSRFQSATKAAKWADILLIQSGKDPVNVINPEHKGRYYKFNLGIARMYNPMGRVTLNKIKNDDRKRRIENWESSLRPTRN